MSNLIIQSNLQRAQKKNVYIAIQKGNL
jgi:hypothetical protein